MSNKKRGLHRGLDALLTMTNISTNTHTNTGADLIKILKINQLTPGQFQPRQTIAQTELTELIASIKTQGILQPLIVRPTMHDKYEIIAGERRWRAAAIAELTEVPVIIKNVSDKNALTIALIENIQRANLNPLEEAIALDRLSVEFKLTHDDIAMAVGKSRATVTNLLRILQLPKEIKLMLESKAIDLGHAKVLLGAPKNLQLAIANKIIAEQLSVRDTEMLLNKYKTSAHDNTEEQINNNKQISAKILVDPNLIKLQREISNILGARVAILQNKTNTKGKLIIKYNDLEELDGIVSQITSKIKQEI